MAIDEKIPKVLVSGDLSLNTRYSFNHIIKKPYDYKEIQRLIDGYIELIG
jgi:hypothetical protein